MPMHLCPCAVGNVFVQLYTDDSLCAEGHCCNKGCARTASRIKNLAQVVHRHLHEVLEHWLWLYCVTAFLLHWCCIRNCHWLYNLPVAASNKERRLVGSPAKTRRVWKYARVVAPM